MCEMTPKKQQLGHNLTSILQESRAASISQNIAEKFLVPFALIMRASPFSISILSTLPQVLGALMQIISVKVLHKFSSRKKLIVQLMFLQALTWLPLFLIPLLFPKIGVLALIAGFSAYYMIGGFFNPAWSHWIVSIVPEQARGRFYGRKNQTAGRFGFLAAAIGGYLLSVISDVNLWLAYGVLFFFGFVAKIVCALCINRMDEGDEIKKMPAYPAMSVGKFLRHIDENSFGKYVLYMCIMSFAVNIAAPFFTPYMLRTVAEGGLGFSYLQFTIMTAVSTTASFLVFRHFGRVADRFGNKKVLVLTGFLIPLVPLFWLFTTNFYYLLGIEIFSGIVWAGFNLCTANYVFDLVGKEYRMIYSAYYNAFTTTAMLSGALIGSGIHYLAPVLHVHDITLLFSISCVLRLAVTFFFLSQLKELREVEGYNFFYELTVHPMQGFVHGTVQSISDHYIHFKRKHMLDIIKIERYVNEELKKK
jgi:MFS family permease